jgi:hypothetical protein
MGKRDARKRNWNKTSKEIDPSIFVSDYSKFGKEPIHKWLK